ncbi:MAG: hypothetical protein J1F40_09300 [Prevotellaceae bacterium]|nr:hypothetical protein [Prevotellaceae bacterium]
MKINQFCIAMFAFAGMLLAGTADVWGQKRGFAQQFKDAVEAVQRDADKDPDTFRGNVEKLEKEWGSRKDAVERSVVDAVLGSCYREMKWTYITDFDEETRAEYERKKDEHFESALKDMEALADAKVDGYEVLLEKGKDSDIFEKDMLSVVLNFALSRAGWSSEKEAEMLERAWRLYRQRGKANGYGKMKMMWLDEKRMVSNKYGRLSNEQYKDSLYQLLQEVKDEEIGADVALGYGELLQERDERILFLKWAVENVGTSRNMGNLRGALDEQLLPYVSRQNAPVLLVDTPSMVSFEYWNCDRVTLTIRRYAGTKKGGNGELLLTGGVVDKKELVFGGDSVNEARKAKGLPVKGVVETEFALPVGHYVCVAEGLGERSVTEFNVTSLRIVYADLDKEHYRLWVVDNRTGRPVEGVKVQCRETMSSSRSAGWENKDLVCELLTDANGVVDVERKWWVRAVRDEQDYTDYVREWGDWRTFSDKKERLSFRVMTDRGMYRPEQNVQGTVVAFVQKGDDVRVAEGDTIHFYAMDAQGHKVVEQEFVTNAYGSASFEFALPADCAVGNLTLHVSNGKGASYAENVKIEEYKRPTFEVTFDGQRIGKFGQTVEVEGTAMMFAGVPVQGGKVHYSLECIEADFMRWWLPMYRAWKRVDEGELTTDDEGHFRVPVTLADEYLTSDNGLMRFRVTATVTDVAGESHEGQWFINVGHLEYACEVGVDKAVDLAKDAVFRVDVYDANHEKVRLNGKYQVMNGDVQVAEGEFVGGDSILLPKVLQLGVRYDLVATVVDSKGGEVKAQNSFVPYSSALPVTDFEKLGVGEKRREDSALQESDFICSDATEYSEGGAVEFYFSTQETDAYIIYNVYNADGLLESHAAVTDGAMKRLRLPYRKEWGEGIIVNLMYVRNGHFVSLNRTFTLAKPDKKLNLEWSTFRDKLQPGQQEQWTLTVTDNKGRRVSGAEMVAVLYDASLDRIYPHSWNFSIGFSRTPPYVRSLGWDMSLFPWTSLRGRLQERKVYVRTFDVLKGFEHNRFSRSAGGVRQYKSMLREVPVGAKATMDSNDGWAVEESAMDLQGHISGLDIVENSAALSAGTVMRLGGDAGEQEEYGVDFDNAALRENFAETAFFLPHLVSDETGNVNVQFTLPESLTEWKFMGLAHTKDMDYGTIKATAVARKAFMLRPNMPRFVRWGDKAVVASSVVNQSDEALSGAVRMRLLDHETGDVVLVQEKPFRVDVGKTVSVEFGFDVQEDWKDLDCELVAASGNASDGEKNFLPVLTTMKEVVETVPFYIIGNADGETATKEIDLSGLYNRNSSTAKNKDLKIEYTDTPAWMCVEALRSIKTPENDNAMDFAASLYANNRLVDLMRTFPVLEMSESEVDLRQNVEKAKEKLLALQKNDGGWCWFSGMNSSYYVTLAVCERLAQIASPTDDVNAMLSKGMAFLDKHELDAYNKRLKQGQKIYVSESSLRYLYVSAQMPNRVVGKDIQQMREKYLSAVEKSPRDLTIYGVANAACALRGLGHAKSADRFVDFLKDYTVEKPGLGRFYATDAAYYSWMDYRIPTQVAAMKAIRQKDKQDAYLNDMQLWLIAQKQVQKWDNPLNTIDVVDLLLHISPTETFGTSQKPVVKIDGKELTNIDYGTINTERSEFEGRESNLALEGNVLADVPSEYVENGVNTLEVEKRTKGISWGAAYATFYENIENLQAYATNELKIQRKLYVQRAGSADWVEYKKKSVLNVGDKLKIRHVITADRDMDFVRLSAQHPACLEPVTQLSGYQWLGGRGGYLSLHDSSFDIFFDCFTRGTSTVDMEYYISRTGTYEMGISSVECAYAKQFGGHTEGMKVNVEAK